MEAFKFYSHVLGPTALFASVICGVAVISSYCFPRQRKFPNIVLVWTCVVDLVLSVYMTMRWLEGPLKRVLTDTVVPGSFTCRCTMSSSLVSVAVAYTLYATIVRNVDFVVYTRKIYYKFVVGFWSISILFPLLSLIDIHSPTQGIGYCTLTSTVGVVVMTAPYCLLFIVQLRYTIPIFIYTFRIKYRLREQRTSINSVYTRGQIWLLRVDVRCVGVQFNQVFLWMNILIYDFKNIYQIPVTDGHVRILAIVPLFLALNGLIVLVGNRSLRKYMRGKVSEARASQHLVVASSVASLRPPMI